MIIKTELRELDLDIGSLNNDKSPPFVTLSSACALELLISNHKNDDSISNFRNNGFIA